MVISKLTKGTLVYVQVAGRACVAGRTGADCLAVDWIGVTVGALLAGVADAGVIEVAQQTCNEKKSHTVKTSRCLTWAND